MAFTKETSDKKRTLLEQLQIYIVQLFAGLVLFGVFVATSIVVEFLGRIAGRFDILFGIVGWYISACGAICCITLIVRNTIVFIKFLIKGPPQETSRPKVVREGRHQ